MTIRPLHLVPLLALSLAACDNQHEPVADGHDGYGRATVPTDATGDNDKDVSGLTDGPPRPDLGGSVDATGRPVSAQGGPAVAGGRHAAEAETVAIEETGQAARDSASAEVDAAEARTRDDNVNQYDRAPEASDALEGGYNDDDKDGDP